MTVPAPFASLLTLAKVNATVMTLASGKIHAQKRDVIWKLLLVITLPAILGTAIGTYIVQYHPNEWLFQKMIGVALLLAVSYLVMRPQMGTVEKELHITAKLYVVIAVSSFVMNIFSGIVGGGGLFLTLFLVSVIHMSFIHAIAYTMMVYALVNFLQMSYLLMTESIDWYIALGVVFGGCIGGYVGTHMQYVKGNTFVKVSAVTVMFIIGVKMMLG